ncbi:MAG: oligosaccharide flippase family protein, partial [Gemmatimonadaceae bacterium]|nr:oligosaccharide flippase family protein [Gemmatimonadaceae bacterium]
AIVLNFVAYSVTSTILVWILLDWRPRRAFSTESARNLWGFSTRIFSATVLSEGTQSLDKVLVGRFLGAAALGPYSLAYSTMLLPSTLLGGALFSAVSPAYSRIQSDKARLERAWLRSKRVSIAVVSPALLALIVVAPDFVHVVFGERWDDAIIPLQLLCVGGLAHSLVTLHWGVLQARGEAGTLLRVTLMSSVVTWAAFAAGLHWGIVGVSAFYAGAKWLLVGPSTWMTTKAVSFDVWAALRAGVDLVPAAVGAAATGLVVRRLVLETALPEALRLILVSSAMFAAYGAIVLAVAPSLVRDIKQVARRRADDGTVHKPA